LTRLSAHAGRAPFIIVLVLAANLGSGDAASAPALFPVGEQCASPEDGPWLTFAAHAGPVTPLDRCAHPFAVQGFILIYATQIDALGSQCRPFSERETVNTQCDAAGDRRVGLGWQAGSTRAAGAFSAAISVRPTSGAISSMSTAPDPALHTSTMAFLGAMAAFGLLRLLLNGAPNRA
jgi:hypothetical protein